LIFENLDLSLLTFNLFYFWKSWSIFIYL